MNLIKSKLYVNDDWMVVGKVHADCVNWLVGLVDGV